MALPTGELTFCFTDVEGSTALLRRLGDAYDAVIADHHRLLGVAMEATGGVVVRTDGDAFFVVFESATSAVAACAHAQQVVAAHPWPDGVALRVRMGLHTGNARLNSEGEYVGLAIHQAARIAAAANGGQVLMSSTTAGMAELPEGAETFRAAGSFRLKDFDEPVALVELLRGGSSGGTPRALPAAGHNLALRRTSFVGRWDELKVLEKLVDACALVTLVGSGGSGKTRLAVEFGASAAAGFSDGVWFVDLSAADGADQVHAAVAHVLGAHVAADTNVRDSITTAIGRRALLLILDNCEHVVAEAADLVDAVVAVCPSVVVLATSRQRLDVPGERVVRLGPLGVPPEGTSPRDLPGFESARLFLDRAGLADSLSAEDAAAVISICGSLDGLPLGIELAASRAPALGVRTVASHLTEMVLRAGPGDAGASARRQRTLVATIRWSYELLSDDERCAFERLSVFSGGFTIDACTGVLDHPPLEGGRVAGLVGELVEKSLVEPEAAPGRFRLLGPVNAFALDAFEASATVDQIRDRHAAFYAASARLRDDFDVLSPREWVEQRLPDEANFAAALRHVDGDGEEGLELACTVALLARAGGRFRFGYDLVTEALRAIADPSSMASTYGTACIVASELSGACGYFGEALERCSTALELASQSGDRSLELHAHARAAVVARIQGDGPATTLHTERAERLARELGDDHVARINDFLGGRLSSEDPDRGALVALFNHAREAMRRGSHDEARALANEAAAGAARIGARAIEVFARWVLAELSLREDRGDEARALLDEAVEIGLAGGLPDIALVLETLGRTMFLELRRHDPVAVRAVLARAEELDVDREGPEKTIHALRHEGEIALELGDAATALVHFGRSLEVARRSGYRGMEVRLLLLIGNSHVAAGDAASAEAAYLEAQELAASLERNDSHAILAYNLALVDHRQSNQSRARERLEALVAPSADVPGWLSGLALAQLGVLAIEDGDAERAATLLTHALSSARARRDVSCQQLCLWHLKRLGVVVPAGPLDPPAPRDLGEMEPLARPVIDI